MPPRGSEGVLGSRAGTACRVPGSFDESRPSAHHGRMATLETVAHCWNYARLLRLHLSQFVISPPRECELVATICHAPEDHETVAVLREFGSIRVPRVRWNFVPLDPTRLCRRAIGRNQVALQNQSDFLLFCDVDYCFAGDSLDRLSRDLTTELQREGDFLGFCESLRSSISHELGDQEIERAGQSGLIPLYGARYEADRLPRPIGGSQWVPGRWARKHGYVPRSRRYQRPEPRWRRTFEDRVFRDTCGLRIVGFDCPEVYRIRHSKRGRFDVGCQL